MRLLLDEMISWRIAVDLRNQGHDVVAVKRDREHLMQRSDPTVLGAAADERRAVVTNNVHDYRPEHERTLKRGDSHYGIIYTFDKNLPRNKKHNPLWVATLAQFLSARPTEDALLNQTMVLIPSGQ